MLCDLGALDALGEIDERGLARLRHYIASRGLRVTDTAGDLLLLEPGTDTLAWLEPVREPRERYKPTRFDGALELLGAGLLSESVEPGGLLPIVTTWLRVGALPGAPLIQWTLTCPDGTVRDDEPRRLGYGLSDVTSWPSGLAYFETYRWVVPADLSPGTYVLSLSLWRHAPGGDIPATTDDPAVRRAEGLIEVGRFRVGS